MLWASEYGYADVSRATPATTSSMYSICSVSRPFTSVTGLQPRDAGKLRLDGPVRKHLSWF